MLLGLILKLSLCSTTETTNESEVLDYNNVIDRCAALLNDGKLFEAWCKNRKDEEDLNLRVENTFYKIKNILNVINKPGYEDLKKLIRETDMCYRNGNELDFLYFETSCIVEAINFIFDKIDLAFESKMIDDLTEETCNKLSLENVDSPSHHFLDSNFDHEDLCKRVLEGMFDRIYLVIIDTKRPREESEIKKRYELSRSSGISDDMLRLFEAIGISISLKYLRYADEFLDRVMSLEDSHQAYYLASVKSITNTKKSVIGVEGFYLPGEYTEICHDEDLRNWECNFLSELPSQKVRITEYMNRPLIFNEVATALFISLIHFHSVIARKDTVYKLTMKDTDIYEIFWTNLKKEISNEEIKDYYMRKEIKGDISKWNPKHKFSYMVEYDIEYSTIQSDDTEDDPISTRLILLSCGHQLGLKLIDEFFSHIYMREEGLTICQLCRKTIDIVGS